MTSVEPLAEVDDTASTAAVEHDASSEELVAKQDEDDIHVEPEQTLLDGEKTRVENNEEEEFELLETVSDEEAAEDEKTATSERSTL